MYGFDDEMEKGVSQIQEGSIVSMDEGKKRKPFAVWTVGGREYRLKLTTSAIVGLEEKFKRNLLDLLYSSGSVPPLAVMLTITQAAMKNWEHGIKYETVQTLFDRYCEEGGTQLTFLTDVLMEIYKVSGFFSESQVAEMDVKMEEARAMM